MRINDTPADALAMARLLAGQLAHVNLIPMNPVAHTPWRPSQPARIDEFEGILRNGGIGTTVRRNRGIEIGAACGQLAADRAGAPAAGCRRPSPRPARHAFGRGAGGQCTALRLPPAS